MSITQDQVVSIRYTLKDDAGGSGHRAKVHEVMALAVANEMNQPTVRRKIEEGVRDYASNRFQHHMDLQLQKLGATP